MKYKLFTIDCDVMGKYHHLYKDGILVEQDDSNGWHEIPWDVVLTLLEISFEHTRLEESQIPDDFLPTFAREWDKYI